MNRALLVLLTTLSIAGTTTLAAPGDPGERDTVRFEIDTLIIGRSVPIAMSVWNDEYIEAIDPAFGTSDDLGGFAVFDSITYVGRMTDPRTLDYRAVSPGIYDGVPPDTFGLFSYKVIGLQLPSGDGPVALWWFTGTRPGRFPLTPGSYLPIERNSFVAADQWDVGYFVFKGDTAVIVEGTPLPVITAPSTTREVAQNPIQFAVSAVSPAGLPVSLQLLSFGDIDDASRVPTSAPLFTGSNPCRFDWSPAASDVGLWQALFRTCDSSGGCATFTTTIQIVAEPNQLVDFDIQVVPSATMAMFLDNNDFDGDLYPEVVVGGVGAYDTKSLALIDRDPSGIFQRVYVLEDEMPRRGCELAYIDDDEFIDIVQSRFEGSTEPITVLLGTGDNAFTSHTTTSQAILSRGTAMINFNGDQYLDYVQAGTDIVVLAGGDSTWFSEVYRLPDSALCVNGADFNNDGYDDLAVSDATRLRIFLNSGGTGFTRGNEYPQEYAVTDIDITNQGSDFNGDGYFDLCLATPSPSGLQSHIVVYLGDGQGAFSPVLARTVKGQTLGNRVGDIDGDGNVDIVYANGATKQIGILFGDGLGAFPAEIRLPVPDFSPYRVTLTDLDLDGDLDIAAGSHLVNEGGAITIYENRSDPAGLMITPFAAKARNGASLELLTPSGKTLTRIVNSIASGSYIRRSLDNDTELDAVATVNVVETGGYALTVAPKPGALRSETFSLDYTLDGAFYRLAKDAPISPDGFTFTVYPSGSSEVAPISGAFIPSATPSFHWTTSGAIDFQLASDPAFTNVLYETAITGDGLTIPDPLTVADTTTLYWRIKPQGQASWETLYAVNLIPASPSLCGDADGNGALSIADLTYLVAYLFRGGPAPATIGLVDLDSSGQISVPDLTRLVGFLFRGQGPISCVQ